MPDLLRRRQADRAAEEVTAAVRAGTRAARATHERRAALRKELNGLVAARHHRTETPHGAIHAELRGECGGPPAAVAPSSSSSSGSPRSGTGRSHGPGAPDPQRLTAITMPRNAAKSRTASTVIAM